MTAKAGSTLRGVLVLVALTSPLGCAAVMAVAMLSPAVRLAVELLARILPYLLIAGGAIALAYAAAFAGTDIVRRWHMRHVVFPTVAGMFPLVKGTDWYDATPDAVKAVAAWTHAQAANGVRPTAAATRAALYAPPPVSTQPSAPALPAPFPLPPAPSGDAFDVDPARSPHVLIVGKTGSGKSTLARHLLTRFTQRHRTEVIVCDPDGVNWLEQTSASSTEGIAAAVNAAHGEFSRRQALLSDGARPQSWPYLILLLEETETVFERLAFVGDAVEDNARFQLREIARMGRKAGVFLWAVTQVAAGDVFDLHVRRNMTIYCALSEPGVGRMLGVPKDVDLTRLQPGTVYASATGQVLRFPPTAIAHLPLSPLYREDGAELVTEPVFSPVLVTSGPTEPVFRLDPGRQPTPSEAAEMRRLYAHGWSKNRITFSSYGYKNADTFGYVTAALENRL